MADLKIIKPNIMDFTNAAVNWPKWFQRLEIYFLASGHQNDEDKVKIAVILNLIGDSGVEIFNSFNKKIGDSKFEEIVKLFEEHCTQKKNISVETFKFNNLTQKSDQAIENFIVELKTQADFCEFKCAKIECGKEFSERMIRDRLIAGVSDPVLQSLLLREQDATMQKIIDICKTHEISKKHVQLMKKPQAVEAIGLSSNQYNISNKCGKCGYFHPEKDVLHIIKSVINVANWDILVKCAHPQIMSGAQQ